MRAKARAGEPKPAIPGYIVTFSDMITLLLTFFVMLLSMAETQVDDHKFEKGVYSFQRSVSDFGISGVLLSRSNTPLLDHPQSYYRVDMGQDEPEQRSIDARTEMMRRVLMDIERLMEISPSHIIGAQKRSFQTSVSFSDGGWELDARSRQELHQLAEGLKINYSGQNPTIYVLALAADVPEAQSWAVSARRGQVVADLISRELPGDETWPIFCWGAGPGGEWVGHSGLVTPKTHILVVALTGGN